MYHYLIWYPGTIEHIKQASTMHHQYPYIRLTILMKSTWMVHHIKDFILIMFVLSIDTTTTIEIIVEYTLGAVVL